MQAARSKFSLPLEDKENLQALFRQPKDFEIMGKTFVVPDQKSSLLDSVTQGLERVNLSDGEDCPMTKAPHPSMSQSFANQMRPAGDSDDADDIVGEAGSDDFEMADLDADKQQVEDMTEEFDNIFSQAYEMDFVPSELELVKKFDFCGLCMSTGEPQHTESCQVVSHAIRDKSMLEAV